jgi:hypothetical protein
MLSTRGIDAPRNFSHNRNMKSIAFSFIVILAIQRPPLWSSGQNFWLQIQRSWVPFPAFPDLLRSSGLERNPHSLVRTTEELLGRYSSGSGQENRDYRLGGSIALTTQHPLSAKVGTTSPTSGGRSVGIVR